MKSFQPTYAVLVVLLVVGAVVAADYALDGGFQRSEFERVTPGPAGKVIIDLATLESRDVRFYRFLNPGNQEVRFFVGRDAAGQIQVAFDANEICYKSRRGYRHEGEWVACNKCDKAFRLAEVNQGGGGCKPVPLEHRVEGTQLFLSEAAILAGWRYFR